MAGFSTAVTGIQAAQTDLDVTGNNIANASTVGFKAARTEFGDIYATAVVGAGSANVAGSGVTIGDISQDFQAGTIQFTNNNLDLAINGSGFFQLDDHQGTVSYTRSGSFELDSDGFMVSNTGKYLQGYGLDAQGNQLPLGDLAVTETESLPHATETIDLAFNIDAALDSKNLAEVYDRTNASSFSYTTTVATYDSLGNDQAIKFNFAEQRPTREVYQFTTTQTAATVTGVRISDVAVTWEDPDSDGVFTPTSASKADIEQQDARIDVDSIQWTGTTMSFEFKAESSATGDIIVSETVAATTTELAVANLNDGNPATRTANEIQSFVIDPALFDATTNNLLADTSVVVGGVTIALDTDMDIDDVGDAISAAQTRIVEQNPDIESVQYNSTSNTVYITWNSDAGDVDAIDITDASGVLGGTATADPESQKGDNSYMSVYRMYAYLNDSKLLDIGKRVDPGESGFTNGTTEVGPIVVKFRTTTGELQQINGQNVTDVDNVPKITILGADPANPNDTLLDSDLDNLVGIQLSITGSSQFASDSIVKSSTQDGYTKGDLIGVTFEETGEMVASYSNGQRDNLGLVALATFANQQGLQPSGDTEWVATLDSGQAILNPPGTGLNGSLQSAALEQSNVDLSEELVALIEAQRNYQANSQTLETLNTVTQTILQI
ncbi:MAG: flagellar hook protein FlgE [Pontibacterium sp.]